MQCHCVCFTSGKTEVQSSSLAIISRLVNEATGIRAWSSMPCLGRPLYHYHMTSPTGFLVIQRSLWLNYQMISARNYYCIVVLIVVHIFT